MNGSRFPWARWRNWLWPFACGMIVPTAMFAWQGENALLAIWAFVFLSVTAALTADYLARLNKDQSPTEAGSEPLPLLAQEILEHLPDPLLLLDNSNRAVFANAAMRAVIGADYRRKALSVLLRVPAIQQAAETVCSGEKPAAMEFALRVPIERHFAAHVWKAASAPLISVFLHDLTAIKRTEQMRADFVANASHELRTPLAAVSGFIDTLRGHAREDAQARERFLEIMSLEAQRMRRLIEDLLSLTRIELNEHVPPSSEIDLEAVIKSAVAALAPLAQSENITLELSLRADRPHVLGDRDELTQLFQNLIQNAIKYGRAGGHVWISLGMSQDMVSVAVKDDGEGIPREAIPRLTERFYRVDAKRSRERGGTGLGLAIVKHIVNRHNGRLQIESELGSGSTFTVSLPKLAVAQGTSVTEVL